MIQVLPSIELIRERPDMYFRGPPTPEAIGLYLLDDALGYGARHVRVDRVERWHIISAEVDWLRLPEDRQIPMDRLFAGFHPNGRWINGVRAEVFVGAFSEVAYVATPDEVRAVVGDSPLPTSISQALCPPPCTRSLAFLFRDG
jgi:hypothetical protein